MAYMCCSKTIPIKSEYNGVIEYRYIPLFCERWDCPVCAKRKWKIIEKKIINTFSENCYMLTLTYAQKDKTLDDVWANIGSSWNRLLAYLKKVRKLKFKYVRIVEAHKSGYPHLHILLDAQLSIINDLKLLESQGFGWSCSIKEIPTEAGTKYLAKYATKGEHNKTSESFRKKYKTRLFSSSRLNKIQKNNDQTWIPLMTPINDAKLAELTFNIFNENLEKGNTLKSLELSNKTLIFIFSPEQKQEPIDFSCLPPSLSCSISRLLTEFMSEYPNSFNLSFLWDSFENSKTMYWLNANQIADIRNVYSG